MKISACMMCYNEERLIERALKSLIFADEIIVVDSFSKDNTKEIAKKYATKFIEHAWPGHAKQMQYAMELATHDWVFFLDADEYCTPDLIKRIEEIKKENNSKYKLYKIHRKEHLFGHWYKYGCGNPSYQDRFFYKKEVHYEGVVHIYPVVKGEKCFLNEYIYHEGIPSLEIMLDKINRYSTAEALDMFKRGIKHPWPYMFFSGLAMFLKGYFKKKGFLDGAYGLIMAISDGFSFYMRQAKLWKLWRDKAANK